MKLPFTNRPSGSQAAQLLPAEIAADFRCLWTVSQFFSVLQRLQLQPERGRLVDLGGLGRRIEEASRLKRTLAVGKLAAIHRELAAARAELHQLDTTIPVAIMRRFFERLGRFDRAALGEVVRYYLAKSPKTAEDRDKVDLLATRFGTYRIDAGDSASWRSVDGLAGQLAALQPRGGERAEARGAIEELGRMRRDAFAVATFADLIERKVVSSVREYKSDLGELFYTPEVLAEVVETNVALHNKFQELYESEMVRLQLEADRLARMQSDVDRLLPALDSHRALSELGSMTLQMQRLLQRVKRDLAERVIVDRDVRTTVEEEGVPIGSLVASCEEALRQTADIVRSLHGALQKAETRQQTGRG